VTLDKKLAGLLNAFGGIALDVGTHFGCGFKHRLEHGVRVAALYSVFDTAVQKQSGKNQAAKGKQSGSFHMHFLT
jgi:hypothetical protein